MAGQQLPRPWFRLASTIRPTTSTTQAPVPEQPRPVPALIRPPLLRPVPMSEPTETTSPKHSVKSPPQLPRPASLTPPMKKSASPPAAAVPRPVLPTPSNAPRLVTPILSPVAKHSESFGKDKSKQQTPVPSPSVPKSIPAVPSPYPSPKPKTTASPQSPPPSPKMKSIASPPSPLVLPPSQLQSVAESKVRETIPQEVERKTVVFQKVVDKPSPPENHFTNYHNPGFVQNGKQEQHKHDEDQDKDKGSRAKKALFRSSADTEPRVITMAGENKGAFMEVILSDKNNSRHHQIRQSNNESQNEETTNNNVNPDETNKSKKKSTWTRNELPMKAFLNSNVQGINNSIMMDSKFTHHDPGIHLVYSKRSPSTDEEDEGQQ